ncbi:elongation of very long chain fatty acids protein AAEL008004-like [Diprion similis]|uniref:elongation of very long chain fatty acids protein AAEL008004-like n=1 Tax=Diprion similis TaxID=362088 RepID=UPI001EF91CF2|nr:elongation of very long chain fatty acids protein AAEL008004-like [Diprion similis]
MGLAETYHYYNVEIADSRTNDWWLISTPLPLMIIIASYLYFVLSCGPRYMRDTKPYSLRTFLTCYNVFQIFYNTWIVYKLIIAGWLTYFGAVCNPMVIDYWLDPMAVQEAEITWWAMILKIIDLSETAVFVLRKKDRQISFLHLYHHVTTVLIIWVTVKYFAGGICTFPVMLNSIVHVIMYTYYMLTARGPRIRRIMSLIKPYITGIQIVQFFVLLVHASQGFSSSCDVPKAAVTVHITNLLINLYLFIHFYRKNYNSQKKTA